MLNVIVFILYLFSWLSPPTNALVMQEERARLDAANVAALQESEAIAKKLHAEWLELLQEAEGGE